MMDVDLLQSRQQTSSCEFARQKLKEEGYAVIPHFLDSDEVEQLKKDVQILCHGVTVLLETPYFRDDVIKQLKAAAKGENVHPHGHHVVVYSLTGSKYTFCIKRPTTFQTAIDNPSLETLSIAHIAAAGLDCPGIANLSESQKVLSNIGTLLNQNPGAKVTQIIEQIHLKAPGDGIKFVWHQDSQHRLEAFGDFVNINEPFESYVNVLIAIDYADKSNGGLKIIPKTHLGGHLNGKKGLDPESVNDKTALCPKLSPGDALVIGCHIIHGSDPNSSSNWRRSLILGFAVPNALRVRASVSTPSMSRFVERIIPTF